MKTEKQNPGFKGKFPFGKEHNFKGFIIKGWPLPKPCVKWYKNIVSNIKNGLIVEVGVFGGVSLLNIADICKENGNKIFGIDPWDLVNKVNGAKVSSELICECRKQSKGVKKQLNKVINKLGYNNTITLIEGFSPQKSKLFKNKSVDIVYIDGDHSYDGVYADLGAWLPKMKKGGFLWGDDFVWESVRTAVIDFCKNNNLKLKHPPGGSRNWYIKI